jgi:aryl carrier-like protein
LSALALGALQALSEWPVAALLRDSAIAYPLVNAAHIMAFGLLLGAIVTLDLRLIGAFRTHPVAQLGPPLWRVAAWGLLLAAVTGFLLFSTRPLAYAQNAAFQIKLGLIGLGLLNVAVLRLNPRWREAVRGGTLHGSIRLAALVSLLAWLATVVAGRWIGFLD